jgi:hypothetical protein
MQVTEPPCVASLELSKRLKDRLVPEPAESIYGGYANPRGEIFLFGRELVYRLNFKNQTVQQRPKLNSSAQARYDETTAGESFDFCNKTFRRLSHEQILDICSLGSFRVIPKL